MNTTTQGKKRYTPKMAPSPESEILGATLDREIRRRFAADMKQDLRIACAAAIAILVLVGLATGAWAGTSPPAPPAQPKDTTAAPLTISDESRDLIVEFETGGQGYYQTKLQRPTVPPGQSGITIGIGYDLGYQTAAGVAADWTGAIPAVHVKRLQGVVGLTGSRAKLALARVSDIIIPWTAAKSVYERRTVPRFAKLTAATYPGITAMHPHVQGVMLSTTFNRGTSLTGDRRRELAWSRTAIGKNNPQPLPGYQLAMRRLWPSIRGLQRRYGAHAGLIQKSIDHP